MSAIREIRNESIILSKAPDIGKKIRRSVEKKLKIVQIDIIPHGRLKNSQDNIIDAEQFRIMENAVAINRNSDYPESVHTGSKRKFIYKILGKGIDVGLTVTTVSLALISAKVISISLAGLALICAAGIALGTIIAAIEEHNATNKDLAEDPENKQQEPFRVILLPNTEQRAHIHTLPPNLELDHKGCIIRRAETVPATEPN